MAGPSIRPLARLSISRIASSSRSPLPPPCRIVVAHPFYLPARASPSAARLRRQFSTSIRIRATAYESDAAVADGIFIKEITPAEYEQASDTDMDTLHESLEIMCEDLSPGDWEVEYSSGVMNLSLPPHGTYVINKQPPNQQIWISSPVSGPARFGYSPQGVWVHHRVKGVTLGQLLDVELRGLLGDRGGEWEGRG